MNPHRPNTLLHATAEAGTPAALPASPPVTLTINGHKVQARAGQTVLDAAGEAGIYIPVLCHHPALPPHGACRMCVVEIEKQRGLQPSCTFPVSEGLVVQTETPRVVEARKFILEMLFSERPHYCMFCPSSGSEHSSDCELQRLAYRYGMTHWQYPPDTARPWPLDATRQHFAMEHSRCILCRRCVRACAHLVGNHTLGMQQRGARTLICADDGIPFAESTCVSCGTCLQICPTGALMDNRSAFLGHEADTQRTRTTCVACAVGCSIETVTREGHVIRVEGVWEAANKGVLCESGRFDLLDDPPRRVTEPLVRRNGTAVECSWDEALTYTAERLRQCKQVAGLITPRSTNQCLVAFSRMFHDIFKSDDVALLGGRIPPLGLGPAASIPDILSADCIVIVGGDPMRSQKVMAYMVKRAVDRGARLVVASAEESGLDHLADVTIRLTDPEPARGVESFRRVFHLRPDRLALVKKEIEAVKRPIVLYGEGLGDEIYTALRTLPAKARFLPLVEGPNAVGASRLGLSVRPVKGDALYVVASDERPDSRKLPEAGFKVVQASYHNEWTQDADVVLPSKVWFEKTGHLTNLEGRKLPLTRSVDAPTGILSDWATLFMLSVKMGQPLTCITVAEPMAL